MSFQGKDIFYVLDKKKNECIENYKRSILNINRFNESCLFGNDK